MLKAHPGRFQAIWAYFLSTKTTEHANPHLPVLPLHLFFPLFPPTCSSPSLHFFFFFPRFSTLQKWDWSIQGFTLRPTSLEDLKFPFRFNRLVWGKFERKTHSQPEDIQYDKKAGSYLITSCINTERASERAERTAYAGWCNANKVSCVPQLVLQPRVRIW